MSLRLELKEQALAELEALRRSGNKALIQKIQTLLLQILETPFTGTGKPEPLKHNLSGLWSRRINRAHRLVYEVEGDVVTVLSVKGHYE